MATIVITSYGTLGDHLPYVALGQALKARGHHVRMAVTESMYPYALKAGLEVVPSGRPNLGSQQAQGTAADWNQLAGTRVLPEMQCRAMRYYAQQGVPYLFKACQGADILISSPQQDLFAAIVAEKMNIPLIHANVTPFLLCHGLEKAEQQVAAHTEMWEQLFRELRLEYGLSDLIPESWRGYENVKHLILAASPNFCQLSPNYSGAKQTGFWFYEDPDWQDWQPSQSLKEFVEQDPKPLVLSFSSLPLKNAQDVVAVHVHAAAQLNRRILIQQGWANFNESHLPPDIDPGNVMFAGFMPQDWLFSHAAALIHHGGIGTIARALRNGCPMLVEPYGNDQFFNARQLLLLGVGKAMHPEKLTVDALTGVLEKILTSNYQEQAFEIGKKINADQGLVVACETIENQLCNNEKI